MQFQPFEPGIDVNGQTIHSVLDGMRIFEKSAQEVLLRHGIGELGPGGRYCLEPQKWYPQGAWLAAFEEISSMKHRLAGCGSVDLLFQIGVAIPRNAQFPPWVKDLPSAMAAIDVAYHMNHRRGDTPLFDPDTRSLGEGIGNYEVLPQTDQREILLRCCNPYPCRFDLGIITAMATRFEPHAKVEHFPPRPCREQGAEECRYRVIW